jgi:AcrR family transcriptional regulator
VARKIPTRRFDDLVRTAIEVFIAQGSHRTQMADIAEAMGIAKGTLYVYVESKEALFLLCLRHANDPDPVGVPDTLPVPTPKSGELARSLRRRLTQKVGLPVLTEALGRKRARNPRVELEAVLRELYRVSDQNHRGIKLIERCGDHPELGAEWQTLGRQVTRDRLAEYIQMRIQSGQFRPVGDVRLAARLVIEVIATWAIHIKWDPAPQKFNAKAAEDNVISFLCRGLLKE